LVPGANKASQLIRFQARDLPSHFGRPAGCAAKVARVRLSGDPPTEAAKNLDVKLSVQLAVLAPSKIELAPGVPAMATRSLSNQHSEVLKFDGPLVAI
jgi:hypothetical protein